MSIILSAQQQHGGMLFQGFRLFSPVSSGGWSPAPAASAKGDLDHPEEDLGQADEAERKEKAKIIIIVLTVYSTKIYMLHKIRNRKKLHLIAVVRIVTVVRNYFVLLF